MTSEVLEYEVGKNPSRSRQKYANEILSIAKIFIEIDDAVEIRAKQITDNGIAPLDALHLASAEEGNADFFCTTDLKVLKKSKSIPDLVVKVISPIQLMEVLENDN